MKMALWWRGLAEGGRGGFLPLIATLILLIPSVLYGAVLRLRSCLYQAALLKSHSLPCPVISVGNLSVGGTGKTPVVAMIARHLLQQGRRVAVLSRGYGGSLQGDVAVVSDGENLLLNPEQCGDEPYLLASTVPGLILLVGGDRFRSGMLAFERFRPDLLLLDDGFQHIRLKRDLNILLLDGKAPFGNGFTLPLGILREPRSAVRRADLVIFTRYSPGMALPEITVPYCCADHAIGRFYRLDDGAELLDMALQNETLVVAFAGIAKPDSFFDGLHRRGITLSATLPLPDHASYNQEQLAAVDSFVQENSPGWILTTEKDGVKLKQLDRPWRSKVLVARLELELSDPALLFDKVSEVLS